MSSVVGASPHENKVLGALLRSEAPLTGRALARVTGLSQSSAQRALVRLRQAGLVEVQDVPPAILYRPNRDHLAMEAVAELLQFDQRLRDKLSELVARWAIQPRSFIVFGSVSLGTATISSDVDVLVVRTARVRADDPRWQEQLTSLGAALRSWTGRRASVIDLGLTDARSGFVQREPYLVEAEASGWLIAGQSLAALAGRRR